MTSRRVAALILLFAYVISWRSDDLLHLTNSTKRLALASNLLYELLNSKVVGSARTPRAQPSRRSDRSREGIL